jgi:hypothetical protein
VRLQGYSVSPVNEGVVSAGYRQDPTVSNSIKTEAARKIQHSLSNRCNLQLFIRRIDMIF